MTVIVNGLISLFFLIHLLFFLRILFFFPIGIFFRLVLLLIINYFFLMMGSFDLSSEFISLFDPIDVIKELSHKNILYLILNVLMGNVIFFDHELFLFEFKSNLVISLSFVVVQQSIGVSI